MVDNSGGFASVAADFLEAVGDEYNRNPKLLFSLRPPWTPPTGSHRDAVIASLHESVSLARLSSLPNLLVPAGLQQLASSKLGLKYWTDCFKIYMPRYWGSLILLFSNILSVLSLKYISLINLWCIICILANDRSICKTSLCERLEALSYKCCLCNGIKYHHPSFPYGTTRANCCLSGKRDWQL